MPRKPNPPPETGTHMYIHVRLPIPLVRQLDAACASFGMDRTHVLNLAVTRLLNEYESMDELRG